VRVGCALAFNASGQHTGRCFFGQDIDDRDRIAIKPILRHARLSHRRAW